MKGCFLSIFAGILALLLMVTLISCTKQKENDDSWINRDVEISSSPRYARPQQLQGDEGAYQSGDRIDLPTIPLD